MASERVHPAGVVIPSCRPKGGGLRSDIEQQPGRYMQTDSTIMRAVFGGFGVGELLTILATVILVFGAGTLPKLGEALGRGIQNFEKAKAGVEASELLATGVHGSEASVPGDTARATSWQEIEA